MKNSLFIFIFCVFFCSCTNNDISKKPENLIPENVMVDLLVDMQLATSAKNTKNKYNQRKVNYMYLVFEKYKIDSLQFKQSNLYYTSQIDKQERILQKVFQKLTDQKNNFTSTKKQKDSIKTIEKGIQKKQKKRVKSKYWKNLFSFPEPTATATADRNITYERFDWGKMFSNCAYFSYKENKLPFRFGGIVSPNKMYTISVYIKMDDDSKPNVGINPKTGDFSFVISNSIVNKNIKITSIGNGIYRCSVTGNSKTTKLKRNGIMTFSNQSKKSFRAVGWQLEEGAEVSPYQTIE